MMTWRPKRTSISQPSAALSLSSWGNSLEDLRISSQTPAKISVFPEASRRFGVFPKPLTLIALSTRPLSQIASASSYSECRPRKRHPSRRVWRKRRSQETMPFSRTGTRSYEEPLFWNTYAIFWGSSSTVAQNKQASTDDGEPGNFPGFLLFNFLVTV